MIVTYCNYFRRNTLLGIYSRRIPQTFSVFFLEREREKERQIKRKRMRKKVREREGNRKHESERDGNRN